MAIPVSAIQALIAAKANLGGGAGSALAPPMPAAPSPFPSTDPGQVAQTLMPLSQQQDADQAQLANEQGAAATSAMQMLLDKLASAPNPMARAAQGGPARPSSAPSVTPPSLAVGPDGAVAPGSAQNTSHSY